MHELEPSQRSTYASCEFDNWIQQFIWAEDHATCTVPVNGGKSYCRIAQWLKLEGQRKVKVEFHSCSFRSRCSRPLAWSMHFLWFQPNAFDTRKGSLLSPFHEKFVCFPIGIATWNRHHICLLCVFWWSILAFTISWWVRRFFTWDCSLLGFRKKTFWDAWI